MHSDDHHSITKSGIVSACSCCDWFNGPVLKVYMRGCGSTTLTDSVGARTRLNYLFAANGGAPKEPYGNFRLNTCVIKAPLGTIWEKHLNIIFVA